MSFGGAHAAQTLKGHAIDAGRVALLGGLCTLEAARSSFLEEERRLFVLGQLSDLIRKALHGAVVGQLCLADKVSQQGLGGGVVLGLGTGQRQLHGVADLQRLSWAA